MDELDTFQIAVYAAGAIAVVIIVAHQVVCRARPRPHVATARDGALAWLVYALLGAAVLLLGGSGISAALRGAMSGWPLLVHTLASAVFLPTIACAALIWASRCEFGRETGYFPSEKLTFWIALAAALVAGASMLSAMSAWVGYAVQQRLVEVHRYSSLVLLVATLMHLYLAAYRRARGKA
ncbi:MAG: hypothetical protein U1D55_05820 [Phycisphaerae bacterium]